MFAGIKKYFKRRYASEGEPLPGWCGIAYYRAARPYGVYCGIPWNLIVRTGYRVYLAARWPKMFKKEIWALRIYHKGFTAGRKAEAQRKKDKEDLLHAISEKYEADKKGKDGT